MFHDLCMLIMSNPLGSFIIILSFIWATERVVTAFSNRKKPDCDCCIHDHEEHDEVIASGKDEDEDE